MTVDCMFHVYLPLGSNRYNLLLPFWQILVFFLRSFIFPFFNMRLCVLVLLRARCFYQDLSSTKEINP